MKWDGDENQGLKIKIFDLLCREIITECDHKISIRNLLDAVDEMFAKLRKISDEW